jgi:hypothetical protein
VVAVVPSRLGCRSVKSHPGLTVDVSRAQGAAVPKLRKPWCPS